VKYIGDTTQSNYYFYYGDDENTKYNNVTDETAGLSMTNKQDSSFRLTKRWYIVLESNMFIVSGSGNSSPYAPVLNSTVHYADEITAQIPALNKGNDTGTIEFAISAIINGRQVTVKERGVLEVGDSANAINTIGYYINSYMPAGEYKLLLYGSEVTVKESVTGETSPVEKTYSAITGEYTIVVLPKEFDSGTLQNIYDIVQGEDEIGNAYPVNGDKKLHDSISDEVNKLNKLAVPDKNVDSYWSKLSADDYALYYDTVVAVTYNVDGRGISAYFDDKTTLAGLNTAGKYTLYYCISAKNYQTVGGEYASDRTKYSFVTTLYTEMRFDSIYWQILNVDDPYFKDVTYTGSQVQTLVPRNQYYNYSFDDVDNNGNANYINVRNGASVTLKLYDPELARWNVEDIVGTEEHRFTEEEIANARKYFKLSDDGQSLQVYFNITPATNSWQSAPQVPGWAYNGFDASVYTIIGMLTYTNAEVYYRIGTLDNGVYNWIDMGGELKIDGTAAPEYFTIDDGVITDSKVIAKLNSLPVGTYFLGSYVNATSDGNVNAYVTPTGSYGRIVLSQAMNRWETTPRLSSFKYSQFVATSNFAEGESYYPLEGKTVQYGIFTKDIANSTAFINETSGRKFGAIDSIVAYLNGLDADKYYFVAYVPSTDNYSELFLCTEFTVSQATNAWVSGQVPSISGWTYNGFNTDLFTDGSANHGTPVYDIYLVDNQGNIIKDENGEYIVAVIDDTELAGLDFDSLIAIIGNLGAGRYNLSAYVEQTDNYVGVTHDIRFTVDKADNEWVGNPPSIDGWTYNSTPSNHTNATTTVYTGAIDYKYYNATLVNGEWIAVDDNPIVLSSSTPAGDYVMVATAPGTDDYNKLVHTVHFTVAKCDNSWDTEPEDRLDWTWGATSIVDDSRLVSAAAMDGGVSYTIYKINDDNTSVQVTIPDNVSIDAMLKTLGVGNYRITTTVTATTNYGELSKVTTVTVSNATLTVITEPSSNGWTWGAAETDKQFTNIAVSTVLADDKVTVTYAIGGSSNLDYDGMLEILKACNAGTHTVTVTVTCPNYNSITRTVNVVIGKADFIWDTNPTDSSWTWDSTSNNGKNVTEPKAHALDGSYVVFTYTRTVGSDTTTYNSFADLVERLQNAPVGTYTINVSYQLENYNSIDKSFTVTVNKATNIWTENEPQASYECEYTDKASIDILQAVAKFGTVVYQDEAGNQLMNGSVAITSAELLNEWIQSLSANDTTPYVFYTVVVADGNNYGVLKVKTEVLITGTKSYWANEKVIEDSVNLTFSDSLFDELDSKLANVIPVGKSENGTTTYTISYVDYNGENGYATESVLTSVQAVMNWIKNYQNHSTAGTYTIKSKFVPDIDSFTTLEHTLTLVIDRATTKWDTTLNDNYYGSYGSIEVANPTVSGYIAPITVILKNLDSSNHEIVVTLKNGVITAVTENGTTINGIGMTLTAFVKTLNAVNTYYGVTYSVEATDNYDGLTAQTSRLYISPILNAWLDST
ncbi:MAG: hypothetical protein K2M64_02170, partial [Clostridia bacterium]|nr:hypothetical protein [Clostridia bacterium]